MSQYDFDLVSPWSVWCFLGPLIRLLFRMKKGNWVIQQYLPKFSIIKYLPKFSMFCASAAKTHGMLEMIKK